MTNPVLSSIQVGYACQYGTDEADDPMDRVWTTGFYKQPVVGPVHAGQVNLDGDGQADLVNHGGPDKAICVYPTDHYPAWRKALDLPTLPYGAFGENLTVAGLCEIDVCIGDTWRIGAVIVQISQPRQPCWKLARRWRIKTLALQVQQTGRTGWYLRVLTEGTLVAGQPLELLDRPHPAWSIARANQIMHHDKADLSGARELAALPSLSASWRGTLTRRVEHSFEPDTSKRLGDAG